MGYGDISPETPLGRLLASAIMILGYGIIAVPTGIVSVELNKAQSDAKAGAIPGAAAPHPILTSPSEKSTTVQLTEDEVAALRKQLLKEGQVSEDQLERIPEIDLEKTMNRACLSCNYTPHDYDAAYCKRCSAHLPELPSSLLV